MQDDVPRSKIYSIVDSNDPTKQSALYKEPIRINLKTKSTMRLDIKQVTSLANASPIYSDDYEREK